MSEFRAFRVEREGDELVRGVKTLAVDDLPEGDVRVEVHYSSLNYKDALSAIGNPGVTRNFPHTPGIDAAGIVLESNDARIAAGDEVIVIGFDLGMGTDGGYGQQIRVPADWVVAKPDGLTLRDSMLIGTAGFTAALCVHKLQSSGMKPGNGPILVTGATGGVGSVAVQLLSKLGYEVTAGTGKVDSQSEFLQRIGASEVISREQLREGSNRPLLKETWGGVVDTVGGDILANAIKSLRYGASAAICGLVNSPDLPATVLPFILRHVNLLGADSVQLPRSEKEVIWNLLAGPWKLPDAGQLERSLTLDNLSPAIDQILAGEMVGRAVVDLRA